jgi:hypothetical protein
VRKGNAGPFSRFATLRQFCLLFVAKRPRGAWPKPALKGFSRRFVRSVVSKQSSSLHVLCCKIRAALTCAVVHVHCIGSGLKMLFWAQRGEEDWTSDASEGVGWLGSHGLDRTISLSISHTSFEDLLFPLHHRRRRRRTETNNTTLQQQ